MTMAVERNGRMRWLETFVRRVVCKQNGGKIMCRTVVKNIYKINFIFSEVHQNMNEMDPVQS